MANPNPVRRLENLTPWRPGQSGNPDGYSHDRRVGDAVGWLLDRYSDDERVVLMIFARAIGSRPLLAQLDADPEFSDARALIAQVGGRGNQYA